MAETLPCIPLKNIVIFPSLIFPISVGRRKSLAAVEHSTRQTNSKMLAVLQHDIENEDPVVGDLFKVGTLCSVRRIEERDSGAQVILEGVQRVKILSQVDNGKFMELEYEPLADEVDLDKPPSVEVRALQNDNLELARKVANLMNPDKGDQIFKQFVANNTTPVLQAYRFATKSPNADYATHQELLEIKVVQTLLSTVGDLLRQDISVAEVQLEIQSKAHKINESGQREVFLRQQKRAIEEALGEGDTDDEIQQLKDQIKQINFPEETRTEIDRELKRLQKMSPQAAEYQVARSYLELVTELPWNIITEDNLDLAHSKVVLDEDHYGLSDVKERILEALAVLQLNPDAKSSILCFVGPPGVGKTSLGQSIARAMGRKFERMSLGGLHDEAELRGHRRTYIGAMPGRVLQAIRRCRVRNPVLMLDELDKLGRDYRGDPSGALMEILDPAQNKEFRDNYLNLPFDLSKVFFITTANTTHTIPGPLLDRLEILELTGYSEIEKVEIAKKYLIPRQVENAGIKSSQLKFTNAGIKHCIQRYTREAGVRELERTIERVARKRAKESLLKQPLSKTVTAPVISSLLGPEKFKADRVRDNIGDGVATGLAWTAAGGDVLYIEASLAPKEEKVTITGQIGQVMQESARAARSYIWKAATDLHIDRSSIEDVGIHIHVPEGAVPKDGPSAGVTMATALASAYSKKAVRDDVAMTGEITLSGLVLPVGGIREKVLAAHRTGIRHVILPKDNEAELTKLPDTVRDDMEFSLVNTLADVVEIAIPELKSIQLGDQPEN